MKISHQWVLEYLPIKIDVEEMSTILTDVGLEVEKIESSKNQIPYLEKVVVGEVLQLEKHPDADKLQIATVDVGHDEPLTIVCGAPNIAAKAKVPVAQVGAILHPIDGGEFKIKKAKIRGIESFGMICSESELGLGENQDGIWVLPADATLGMSIVDYLDLENADTTFTIGLTPNRTDGMSHIGVARNIAAYLSFHRHSQIDVTVPEVKFPTSLEEKDTMSVRIDDIDACPRYMGITLENIQIGPSPAWMQDKLRSVGVKPINNIVDITNYVLKECGQPLHAFDRDKIAGDQIIVRKAQSQEVVTTLDGVERKMTSDDLLICDAQKALAIAGVYGGADSGVTADTARVFIESAFFDATTIRRTSMKHQLRTDAATRYEKGVDVSMLRYALYRATLLMMEYADAEIASQVYDEYPDRILQHHVKFSVNQIEDIIGKEYSPKDIQRLLQALQFELISTDGAEMEVAVPFALNDVQGVADIAEEVLRIDGLNNVPIDQHINLIPPSTSDFIKTQTIRQVRQVLSAIGLQEIMTNSIVNSKYFSEEEKLVKMINNLSADLDAMRPVMLHSGLEAISYNTNRQQDRMQFFEIGKTYAVDSPGKYIEEEKIAIWMTGNQSRLNWQGLHEKQNIYSLRSAVEQLFSKFGIRNLELKKSDDTKYYDEAYQMKSGRDDLAFLAKAKKKILQEMDIKQDVWYAEIPTALLMKHSLNQKSYRPVSKYPYMRRDLALVMDQDMRYEQLEETISKLNLNLLQDYKLFDIYEGDKIAEGKKSLAMSFYFESSDKTLTVEEVDKNLEKIVISLQNKLGVELRQ